MSHTPDYALMLSGWLQEQFGEEACITHEDTAAPIGDNTIAEIFTVTLPTPCANPAERSAVAA